ncbi:unnamed protein product [Kluyveromyces dobzhanskii CBS 2104]|uniref:Dihydrofolate reductase n=1 Tax=Kluyveromyces dobzhanskii CBS 2104 TaxID=1427455 RepID=A0A0A8L3Z8_9SACH|nr:unnamed protein product [Kluyveromyces dobzhanskii CBS 2104]
MKYFRQLTSATRDTSLRNAVVMGRKTWDSIPPKFRPLPNRLNVVVSRHCAVDELDQFCRDATGSRDADSRSGSGQYQSQSHVMLHASDLARAIDNLVAHGNRLGLETIYIIGGGEIYRQCIPMSQKLFITKIVPDAGMETPPMDTFLDAVQIESQFVEEPFRKLQELVPTDVILPSVAESESWPDSESPSPTISERGFTYAFSVWSRVPKQ